MKAFIKVDVTKGLPENNGNYITNYEDASIIFDAKWNQWQYKHEEKYIGNPDPKW